MDNNVQFFPQIDPQNWTYSGPNHGFDWGCIVLGVYSFYAAYNLLMSWCLRNPDDSSNPLEENIHQWHFIHVYRCHINNSWKLPKTKTTNSWNTNGTLTPSFKGSIARAQLRRSSNFETAESGPHSHLHRPRRGHCHPTCSLAIWTVARYCNWVCPKCAN